MNARFGMKRKVVLGVTALIAITAGVVPASALTGGGQGSSHHWGVITRNTIGSPVAALKERFVLARVFGK
ncbi:hypothetical protein ACFWHQ_03415 [Streptomyces sp. NPDC060334]|uniref:hypothetical protein n=1 Tax=Streptomyces sp. NPDC060334 TaxID=3347099 RepID=UPI0036546AD3